MLCPVCNIELKLANRQGVEIDYCPQCRGIWLDRGELEKLIDRSAAPFEDQGERSHSQENRGDKHEGERYQGERSHGQENRDDKHGGDRKYGERRRGSFLGDLFDF